MYIPGIIFYLQKMEQNILLLLFLYLSIYDRYHLRIFQQLLHQIWFNWMKKALSYFKRSLADQRPIMNLAVKIAKFWLSKSIFYVKNHPNPLNFFFHWTVFGECFLGMFFGKVFGTVFWDSFWESFWDSFGTILLTSCLIRIMSLSEGP